MIDNLLLKPGEYQIEFIGNFHRPGSEIAVTDHDGAILLSEELPASENRAVYNFRISPHPLQIQIRMNYDPLSGPIEINHIQITCDHVIYKENIITHLLTDFVLVLFYSLILLRFWRKEILFKIFPFFSDRNTEISLIILTALTVLVSVPLLKPGQYVFGIDTLFHLSRIRGVAADLQAGIFPPRIELYWLNDMGYGVGLFYPEIFLIFPAILYLIGFPIIYVYKILEIILVFSTLLSHYWVAKKISEGNHFAGVSAVVFIAFAIYRIQNQFIRDGLGEVFASIFLPLIVGGFVLIFRRRSNGWKILSFGFTGTLLSHTLSFVLAIIFSAIFLLTQIK